MRRTTSWFDPFFSAESAIARSGVIAQIFFDTNSHSLNHTDQGILNLLVGYLRTVDARRRVEVMAVGHADHRGKASYNKILARRRCSVVTDHVNSRLRNLPYFSTVAGLSSGEQKANQNTSDPDELRWDRRVDIYSTVGITQKIDTEVRIDRTEHALRTSSTSYSKVTSLNTGGRRQKPWQNVADDLGARLKDYLEGKLGKESDLVPGKERTKDRKLISVPITHRVNNLVIIKTYKTSAAIRTSISTIESKIHYTWGSPKPSVSVKLTTKTKNEILFQEVFPSPPKTKTFEVPRNMADSSPIFFPK